MLPGVFEGTDWTDLHEGLRRVDPEKHMTPNGGTTSLIANYPLVPHTKPDVHELRQLAMQERAIRWLSFWRRACTKASVWQRSWPAGLTDHITLTGEDLLAMVIAANDHRTQLTLSATCTSLRGLVIHRLLAAQDEAVRKLYLSGAMGR